MTYPPRPQGNWPGGGSTANPAQGYGPGGPRTGGPGTGGGPPGSRPPTGPDGRTLPPLPPLPAGPGERQSSGSRRVVFIAAGAGVVVVAVVVLLLVGLGGGHGSAPGASPGGTATVAGVPVDARAVASTFATLEARRYNVDPTPDATRTTYGAVSCQADLEMMAAAGPPLPPLPPAPHITMTVASITPTGSGPHWDGRYVLNIVAREDGTVTGDGLFYLVKDAGWRVCGLYQTTAPPPTTATPSATPSGGEAPPATDDGSGGASVQTVNEFLTQFTGQVAAGDYGTAMTMICRATDSADPLSNPAGADAPVKGWAQGHAMVHVESVDTSGGPTVASVRVLVAVPGQPPTTHVITLDQPSGAYWCIGSVL